MRHNIISVIISAAVALGILVPAVAFAQTSTTGLLTVYVQVINQTGYSAFQTLSPGNFTVQVSGNVAGGQSSFQGSQNGTPVSLLPGSYNVTVAGNQVGFAPSYSVGCNNTIAANQTQTCVITMTPNYGYTTPNYYGNNYYNSSFYPYFGVPPLSCRALTPSVQVNQPVTFEALGGAGGTFNWTAPYSQQLNYPNAGQQVTVAFQIAGQQSVTVTNAAQTASCSVLVTNGFYPQGAYGNTIPPYAYNPSYNPVPTNGPTYYPGAPAITVVPTTYPQLPRTGFGPHDASTGIALAIVMLIAAGVVTAPYARKALAIVSR